MVKVSIVLPTYNQSTYLPNAIQTILSQTYQDFELIIVNDGSTDATSEMLASIQHPKLRVISQQNQGLPAALNTGFAAASGEYWTWTSTDNLVAPTWLEELVKALDNSPADVGYAFSHYAVIDEKGNILYVNQNQRFDIPTLLTHHTGNASFLYRSSLAKNIGPYDTSLMYAEDLDMWIRMAEKSRAIHVETVLYYYREHTNSMTSQQQKVKEAAKKVVNKYLANTGGAYDIDRMYPSIRFSKNQALERWKARIRLVTIGYSAIYYCPVDALVDQLIRAMNENYQCGLVANIVHLYMKENRWADASKIVALYQQQDPSDFLAQLSDIVSRQATDELQKIPYLTLDEKFLGTDCECAWSQHQLLRNLSPCMEVNNEASNSELQLDKIAVDLVNCLEDQKDHPEVWRGIAALQDPKEKNNLLNFRDYLTKLASIPQDPTALLLINVLEAVCYAYTGNVLVAKNKLFQLMQMNPNLSVISGALHFIIQDETLIESAAMSDV